VIGGYGANGRRRADVETIMRANLELSDRHREWGDDCPMVDLDYLLVEYNHGTAVAIVDYKFHRAVLDRTNRKTNSTLSGLYDAAGRQLPFFIARYWPDTWAFRLKAVNGSAIEWLDGVLAELAPDLRGMEWIDLTEHQYVYLLYRLRKDVLSLGDRRYLAKLNRELPPAEAEAA
jgi:hypothetical protein